MSISIIDVSTLSLPEKGDVIDWLAMHPGATAQDIQQLPCNPFQAEEVRGGEQDDAPERSSNASSVVDFCLRAFDLFHDKNRDVYATSVATGENYRLSSNRFRDLVTASFYQKTGKTVRDQSYREAISTLSGTARHAGECHEVYTRTAGADGLYYLDLGQTDNNKAIKISADGWEIIENPPVRFIRPESMRPLPIPEPCGNFDVLWSTINMPENYRLLVLAWLGESLRPDTPYPIFELIGEHGTAKSTTQIALRRLIDPNGCELRAIPKATEDIFVSAGVNCVVSYENVSYLTPAMQDALCVIATGAGYASRKFYTNADEHIISVKRPIILNGIAAAITAQDLVDRTISAELPPINKREEITALLKSYDEHHSKLLGALLDAMGGALKHLPGIQIPQDKRPRLIEFARLGMAMAKSQGRMPDEFLNQFTAAKRVSLSRTIDASPVASAVIEWMEENPFGGSMTAKVFMERMEKFRPQRGEGWPHSPKGFADSLRRAAPALRQLEIECKSSPKTGGKIMWDIRPQQKSPEQRPESPASPITDQPARTSGHAGLDVDRFPHDADSTDVSRDYSIPDEEFHWGF